MVSKIFKGAITMRGPISFKNIYLYKRAVDFRKSIDGLYGIISTETDFDIFSKSIFVFTNKRKNKVKILYWDKTGFALWYKRLEKNYFRWPIKLEEEVIELPRHEPERILDGIDILKIHPHKELFF